MKRKKFLLLAFLAFLMVVSFVFAGLILWKRNSKVIPSQSFAIAKAWWPVWDTFQIGVQQREMVEHSFDTTFLQKEDYVSALNEFQGGKADAATLTIYEAILAASRGTPLKIVLLLDYTIGSDGVVAKKMIRSLLDLKGKRIGVEKGTIAHFTVLKALEKAGLEQKEVQLVNFDLAGLQQAFLHNEVDAVGTYEPYMSKLAREGNGYVIFSSREIPRAICDVLFVKEAIARDHPDVIDHWIQAWNDALDFKKSDPENCFRMLNRLNGTPIPDIKESFEGIFFCDLMENRMAFGSPDHPGYLLGSLREMEAFMLEQGVIQQRLPLKDFIEFEGIQKFFKH
jgi:NitT/TauT family transport system substrate-binding protein